MTETKRKDVISSEDYFMGVAFLSARQSRDPRTQVGACIVNEDDVILSTGYNHMPRGCSDDDLPWSKGDDLFDDKHSYVCHAEMDAFVNSKCKDLKKCRIYVTLFPCKNCAKIIVQTGIKEVVYLYAKPHKHEENFSSKRLFDLAGVKYRLFSPEKENIKIDFVTPLKQSVLSKL